MSEPIEIERMKEGLARGQDPDARLLLELQKAKAAFQLRALISVIQGEVR